LGTDPSPQHQAAKQILASGQRPFSEEETVSKSIAASDMNGEADSSRILPSTPQPPPRPRPGLKDDRGDDRDMISTEEKEYSTLVNRLQDKEARLNWMLEAVDISRRGVRLTN
jgi:hypothetical protein